MIFTVYLALYGWFPIAFVLFLCFPPRRAVLISFVVGWLLLPVAQFPLSGIPDYDKITAISISTLMSAVLFDGRRLIGWRPTAADLPVLIWCLVAIPTSVSNGLGLYDGVSELWTKIMIWGIPIILGRIYFTDFGGQRELGIGLLVGTVIYMPLCWVECRLSPQLHFWTYGFFQHHFLGTVRYGGFRPLLFLQNSLAVARQMRDDDRWWKELVSHRSRAKPELRMSEKEPIMKRVLSFCPLLAGLSGLAMLSAPCSAQDQLTFRGKGNVLLPIVEKRQKREDVAHFGAFKVARGQFGMNGNVHRRQHPRERHRLVTDRAEQHDHVAKLNRTLGHGLPRIGRFVAACCERSGSDQVDAEINQISSTEILNHRESHRRSRQYRRDAGSR